MRKKNNMRARIARSTGAILRTNHVAVVNIDPSGKQGMINWKTLANIRPSKVIADSICDYPHRWSIYLCGMCIDSNGNRYYKAEEVSPQGIYLAEHLEDVIEQTYKALIETCNRTQLVASGWIAIPDDVSLDEEQAARIFEAVGAWNQQKECA